MLRSARSGARDLAGNQMAVTLRRVRLKYIRTAQQLLAQLSPSRDNDQSRKRFVEV